MFLWKFGGSLRRRKEEYGTIEKINENIKEINENIKEINENIKKINENIKKNYENIQKINEKKQILLVASRAKPSPRASPLDNKDVQHS